MKLLKGEFTTSGFLEYLKKEFGNKVTERPFNSNDVAQYLSRGYTPYRYGHLTVSSTIQEGVRIIKVESK